MEWEELFLPDWSPPDNPALALPSKGRHVTSDNDNDLPEQVLQVQS